MTGPLAIADWLTQQGVPAADVADIEPEFVRRLGIVSGRRPRPVVEDRLVIDDATAYAVLDEMTGTCCRSCGSSVGVEESDDNGITCDECGFGSPDTPALKWVIVEPLPVQCRPGTYGCGRCGRTFTVTTFVVLEHIEPLKSSPVCRWCATVDPNLGPWQAANDVSDLLDVLFQRCTGQKQRELIAAHINHTAGWFSTWRSDAEPDPDAVERLDRVRASAARHPSRRGRFLASVPDGDAS